MIAILGGGISGLACAYYLQEQGKEFILLEAAEELGGKIQSRQEAGLTFELGPNTVLINNPEIKQMLDDLGLSEQIIEPDPIAIKSRFVLKQGKIEAIPNSFKTAWNSNLFKASSLWSILKEPFQKAKAAEEDESLASFSKRRFGKQIYDDLITPFVTGIYAGDPEKMSVSFSMKLLKQAEAEYGSVLKGMPKILKAKKEKNAPYDLPKQKIFTFKNGLAELIQALENRLNNKIQKSARITELSQLNGAYNLKYLQAGEEKQLEVQEIISTLPAPAFAQIIKDLDEPTANTLAKLPYVSALTAHFAFPKKQIGFKQPAFGILSRKDENVPFLGVLFNSRFFPHTAPDDTELITVIAGGYRQAEMVDWEDQKILNTLENALQELLEIDGSSSFSNLKKWKAGIPQYELGHQEYLDSIKAFEEKHPQIKITGNYKAGVSVSDCIQNAAELVRKS